MYHCNRTDFKEEENPYEFLQEGNVLIIGDTEYVGFEWTTVIVFEDIADDAITYGDMMRCTTNIIVVKFPE